MVEKVFGGRINLPSPADWYFRRAEAAWRSADMPPIKRLVLLNLAMSSHLQITALTVSGLQENFISLTATFSMGHVIGLEGIGEHRQHQSRNQQHLCLRSGVKRPKKVGVLSVAFFHLGATAYAQLHASPLRPAPFLRLANSRKPLGDPLPGKNFNAHALIPSGNITVGDAPTSVGSWMACATHSHQERAKTAYG